MSIIDGYDPPQPLNQYRPYGDFGPVCDSLAPIYALPTAILDGAVGCTVDADCPPGYICVNGVCVPDRVRVWPPEGSGWPEPSPRINCRERIRDDGTVEYYDCLVDVGDYGTAEQYDSRCILVDGVCLNWQRNSYLDLEIPDPDPAPSPDRNSCRPFDPDINIRPVTFTLPSGVSVTRYAIPGSIPTTYEVSGGAAQASGSLLVADFSDDGQSLVITGSGVGVATFAFEWNYSSPPSGIGTPEDGGDGLWWPTGFFSLAPSGGGAGTPGGSYLYLGSEDDAAYYLNYTAYGLNPGGGSSYDDDFLTLDSQEYFNGTPYTTVEYTLSGDPTATVYTTTYTSSTTVTLPQNAIDIKFIVAGARGGNTNAAVNTANSRVGGDSVLGRFSVKNNDTSQTKTIVLDIPTVGGDGGTLVCCGPRSTLPNTPAERVAPPPLGAPGGTGISNGGSGSVGGYAQFVSGTGSSTWYENEGAGGGGAAGVTYNGSLIIVAGGGGGATGIATTGGDGGARNGLPAGFFDAAVPTTGGESASTYGTAVGSIELTNGYSTITFTQTPDTAEGSQTELLDVTPGTYAITYTGLHASNNPISVQDGGTKICLYDGLGNDCNAQLRIVSVDGEEGFGTTLWSEDGDRYGVWVNAAECTLPCEEQSVTYTIDFAETATYYFEFGADDSGELYFDNEVTPFLTATTPNILNPLVFSEATDPAKTSKVITAGEHEIVVNCTNASIIPTTTRTYYFGTSSSTNTGSVTQLASYNNFSTTSSETTSGYYFIAPDTYAYHNFSSDTLDWWENKNDDPVTEDFNMTGGSGSGLVLNLTLAPQIGTDAGNLCTRIRINEIVDAGSGYEVGDLLSIPGYPFETPPFRVGEIILDEWYTNFQSSNAVFIRTQNQPGWTNNGGSDGNEVAGLDVPSDSPTGKYLSFGVIDEEGVNQSLVTLRTCQFDLDLAGATQLTLYVCGGSDYNGGEIPNQYEESLQFSFDNASWIKPGVSKEFAGVSRAQYADQYGVWYPYNITIPDEYKQTGQTVYFQQEITGSPEYMTGYNGLSDADFTSRYPNGGDMYGIYKVEITSPSTDYGCENIHPDSYIWNRNPGGWYIKICKDAPCTEVDNLPWVRCSSPWFDSLLQQYGVWTSSTDPGPLDTWQELNYNISITREDVLTLEASADNRIQITFNGIQHVNHSTLNQIVTTQITGIVPGNYILTMRVMNDTSANGDNGWSGNPAGGAWKLSYSNGEIIRTSADLSQTGSSNLYWHTRMASGYRYTTVPQGNESQ